MEAVIITLISAVPATIAAWAALVSARRVKGVHDEVRTNNGVRQGEYVEATAYVVGKLTAQLEEHTAADERNFEELRKAISNG